MRISESEVSKEDLKERTQRFALRIIRAVKSLPKSGVADVIGRQLLRSGCSVGADYRAACRARSTRDFISKMTVVEEEADETIYWMELLCGAGVVEAKKLASLKAEADELVAISVASVNTARKRR